MAKRKARIDSAAEAVRVMAKAAIEILPTHNVPLDEGDEPFSRNALLSSLGRNGPTISLSLLPWRSGPAGC